LAVPDGQIAYIETVILVLNKTIEENMRFEFGKNWQSFSKIALDKQKINQARNDFQELFSGIDLKDKSFIDIGFGQGLTLIFAREAGSNALGIDIDRDNIYALREILKHFPGQNEPKTRIVSILDKKFIDSQNSQNCYHIVHSWGVLHHTGSMYEAITNASNLVSEGGYFVISIYNKHWSSPVWRMIKWFYNKSPVPMRKLLIGIFYVVIYIAKLIVTGKNPKIEHRGMEFLHNVIDWIGGYPYEYASTKNITKFVNLLGFETLKINPARVPTGCNEFVFRKKKE